MPFSRETQRLSKMAAVTADRHGLAPEMWVGSRSISSSTSLMSVVGASRVYRFQRWCRSRPKKASPAALAAGKLASVIKSACDAMRKDAGPNGDLDRIPQIAWNHRVRVPEIRTPTRAFLAFRSRGDRIEPATARPPAPGSLGSTVTLSCSVAPRSTTTPAASRSRASSGSGSAATSTCANAHSGGCSTTPPPAPTRSCVYAAALRPRARTPSPR